MKDLYVIDLKTMNVVLLVDGVKHVFVQLVVEGVFDDRKDKIGHILCETKEALENAFIAPMETYDVADLTVGRPDCIARLAGVS